VIPSALGPTAARVERTLLSAAFDFAFDFLSDEPALDGAPSLRVLCARACPERSRRVGFHAAVLVGIGVALVFRWRSGAKSL